jgi:hypothetical protein
MVVFFSIGPACPGDCRGLFARQARLLACARSWARGRHEEQCLAGLHTGGSSGGWILQAMMTCGCFPAWRPLPTLAAASASGSFAPGARLGQRVRPQWAGVRAGLAGWEGSCRQNFRLITICRRARYIPHWSGQPWRSAS